MRTKNKKFELNPPSFIEQARRTQIIACAIETIAELGYGRASLAQIGKCARVSKGVITYHFASKEELMQAVVEEVFGQFAGFVVERITTDQPWDALRAFLQANADFLKAHRKQLLALFEIVNNAHDITLQGYNRELDLKRIAQLLTKGQRQGVFRSFDVQVMAMAILALRDSLIVQSARHAGLDIDHYIQEIITLIDYSVRSTSRKPR